jgi:hypothetical protein
MQTDRHDFPARIVGTIIMTLIPVLMIAFVTMPASLHHHLSVSTKLAETAPQHMT